MKKILVIDDDQSIRKSLADLLDASGFTVKSASGGIEGLKLCVDFQPDLIICDVLMPDMDGFAVLHEINKRVKTTVPFIFLTAKSEITDLRKGMELGADDYLFKPVVPSELLKAIEIRLTKHENISTSLANKSIEEKQKIFTNDNFLILNSSGKPVNIKIGSIVYLEALEKYSDIYTTDKKKIMVRKLIKEWEQILPKENFARIHRSIIINLEYVSRFEKYFNNSIRVYMKVYDMPLDISKRYAVKLREQFGI